MKKISKVTVHGGHNPSGKTACGAVGILDESKEDRIITKMVVQYFEKKGIDAVDCTVNDGINQSDVLKKICGKCNAQKNVDLNISIHFNSGAKDFKGNGKTTGTEVWLKTKNGDRDDIAKRICHEMEKLGFTNRGVKVSNELYFLNATTAPSVLVEVCFVDDKDDATLYNARKKEVAHAIVKAVLKHNKACE